jgi:hypothetical protein
MQALCWLPRLFRLKFGRRSLRVTFDSNAWQPIVRPDKFPRDLRQPQLLLLNRALRCGRIQGFLADVQATLEAIPKGQRGTYFASLTPHPGLKPILEDRLRDATTLNIRLLHTPRIGLKIAAGIDFLLCPPDGRGDGWDAGAYIRCHPSNRGKRNRQAPTRSNRPQDS